MKSIDIHVHIPAPPGHPTAREAEKMAAYFKADSFNKTVEEMAEMYHSLDMMAVIFGVDAEAASGVPFVGNDYVADAVKQYPEQFIGFASVDPWKQKFAVQELERSVHDLGLRGLKLHPTVQGFFPNDRLFYPLWEKCAELQIPVMFHSGQTGVGAGMPGGNGFKLKYSQPIPCIDDIAADFPELTIIMAHPAVPWQEEQLSVAVHKGNVFVDLSGWSPKYFRPSLVQYLSSLLKNKVMFGSDFPALTPARWLKDFETLDLKPEIRRKILLDNARKLLKLPQD